MSKRREPPVGYVTSTEAMKILGNKMLYKYVEKGLIKPHGTDLSKHKYYLLGEVQALRDSLQAFYGAQEETPVPSSDTVQGHHLQFAQATPDEMEGVYAVASKLFGQTTSAEARKPLVARCPTGNYIIRDNGQIVAYIHIQPLKEDRMAAFLRGEIRGSQIRADDIECFVPGKPTDVLIKSVGAIGSGKWTSHYIQRLLIGAANDLGRKGILLSKIYATSETETGIAMSIHAEMKSLGKIGKNRYAFELDVASSKLPAIRIYRRAFAQWQQVHAIAAPIAASERAEPDTAHPTHQRRATPTTDANRGTVQPAQSEMPEGLIGWRSFAKAHGVAETTVAKAIKVGRLQIVEGRWKTGMTYTQGALDEAGRKRFFELWPRAAAAETEQEE